MSSVADALASVEASLADADADLITNLGGLAETSTARLWRGQVLVDWEPDPMAGGILLRVALLRRLVALHATVDLMLGSQELRIVAAGRVVAGLSPEHAELVTRLGGARRVELRASLQFDAGIYCGGREAYYVIEGGRRAPLVTVTAHVRPRFKASDATSPRTSLWPS